ncbi:hypothetical protein [Rhodococcus sp. RCBS9]|uniref:hypothetical protein n=1 Tax=Rhodococcus sp. RCBS9 TaxID=3031999 RepID=UPI0024029BBD|nr:hypothetical protein [Rhodococcus sp. RCBS9]WEX03827.1 hypothetical protein P0M12_30185 [Rhodococcus sp. RCBS9]WEX03906.1 hypothetical protein P0M12_00200 [Rhodococcus sp. RCBS9]
MNAHDVFVVDSAGVTTIERREQLPWVRLWDENWNLVRVVQAGWRIDEPEVVVLPWSDPAALWLWRKSMLGKVYLTVDCGNGNRWSGRVSGAEFSDGGWVSARFESYGVVEATRDALDLLMDWLGVPRLDVSSVIAPLVEDAERAYRKRYRMDGSFDSPRVYLPNLEV